MKIHFIGVGGIGVSALAQYYLHNGHQVSGSDLASSEITDKLKKLGARIFIGKNNAKNLSKDTDLVVYSPAVQKNNPELAYALKNKIKALSYPQALGEMTREHFTVAVSGTQGKSTTTALLALILIKAGLNPTVILGTKLKEFGGSNFRPGGELLLIEADEHFASFLNYWPRIIVLTNVAKDHLDYYKNLNNILKTFARYIGHIPQDGALAANWDDANTRKILSSNSRLRIQKYSLKQPEAKRLKKIMKVPGEHNIYNALAALAAARILKVPDKISLAALSSYRGAWRRFEIVQTKPFILISDYGHNPVKVIAALKAAREKYPKKKIWCVYQPHQHQRTHYLFSDFVKTFRAAPIDQIIITDIYDVAGREEKATSRKVDSTKLVKAVNKESVIYLAKPKIVPFLKKNVKPKEVVIVMGAGDIYQIIPGLTPGRIKRKIR